jgi:hypothetical protein
VEKNPIWIKNWWFANFRLNRYSWERGEFVFEVLFFCSSKNKNLKSGAMKLKTIIVEDEVFGQEALVGILTHYCNDTVEIIDQVETVSDAVSSIKNNNPHLVFS